ncbi:GFA family protein [Phyllobacteriaceae bacterium SYSU D60012]|uniref:GFA family protein n=1 Tax=Taklimakanibacter lacteus TaxID=2268456 RepID=UPI000E674280
MVESREARCACGDLSVTCGGEPVAVSLCHCLDCQKRTGSAYGIAAFFSRDRVKVSGPYGDFTRASDSGHDVTFHFCPRCGSTVYWEPSRKPGLIAVAVGAFADPAFPAPGKRVYTHHQHHWVGETGEENPPG